MKLGTLTPHHSQNYGGVLQAYALQQALQKLPVESEIVDYRFPGNQQNMSLMTFSQAKTWKSIVRWGLGKVFFEKRLGKRLEKSLDFIENYLPVSERIYRNEEELTRSVQDYQGFITGSDQVWNCKFPSFTGAYLLDFVPRDRKKISYAASFGIPSLPQEYIPQFRKALQTFDAISVREEQGIEMVKEISGREATWVLDPTLLLNSEDWAKITPSTRPREKEYILCYFIDTFGKSVRRILGEIQKKYQMPIVNVGLNNPIEYFWPKVEYAIDAGPRDFVHYIQHASAVVTNSFHGSVFSLIFGKPLCVVTNTNPFRKSMNSRILSLAKRFDIQNCIQDANKPYCGETPCQCDVFKQVIAQQQADSFAFLKKAILDS